MKCKLPFTEAGSVHLSSCRECLVIHVENRPQQLDLPLHSLNKLTVTSLANHTEKPEMLCHQDDIPLFVRVRGKGREGGREGEREIDATARASGTDTVVN